MDVYFFSRSLETNLILSSEFTHEYRDKGIQVDTIYYTDFTKGIDEIDHGILLSKHPEVEEGGTLLKWK